MNDATSATAASNAPVARNTSGSCGFTWKSMEAIARASKAKR